MTREQFEQWARRHGWVRDQWGHYRKGDKRFKLSTVSARLEARSAGGWVRLRSGYFSKLSLNDADKLVGMTF